MSGPLDRYFAKQGKRKIDQTETGSADEGHETNFSCLNVSTTEDLIRIGLEGPAVDQYDPTSAVHRWLNLSTRARRPTFRHWPTAIDVIETNNDENSDLSEN